MLWDRLTSPELATNYQKFGEGLLSVALFELKPEVAELLEDYSQLQKNLKEVYDNQSQADLGTIGAMTDEYLRMIGAVRAALNSRTKVFSTWQSLYNDLERRRVALPKAEKSYNFMRYSELKEEMNQVTPYAFNANYLARAPRHGHQARV